MPDGYVHIGPMLYICHCYCITGHSLGALMYLKPKTLNNVLSAVGCPDVSKT